MAFEQILLFDKISPLRYNPNGLDQYYCQKRKGLKMKRVLSVLCIVVLSALLVLTAGCDESQQGSQTNKSGDKRARLVYVENASLKKQIGSLQQQINSLQQKLQRQKDLVDACQQAKARIGKDAMRIEPNLLKIFDELAKKHRAFTAEIAELKAEIADLKAATKD
jgi:peptidoglycan hydrolase CwlO-like protein